MKPHKNEQQQETGFWHSPTIEELAEMQRVGPLRDVRAFFGTWSGDKDDGFEEDIERLRQSNLVAGGE